MKGIGELIFVSYELRRDCKLNTMKLHQVLTGATNTFDDKAAIAVGSVDDHPFTVYCAN